MLYKFIVVNRWILVINEWRQRKHCSCTFLVCKMEWKRCELFISQNRRMHEKWQWNVCHLLLTSFVPAVSLSFLHIFRHNKKLPKCSSHPSKFTEYFASKSNQPWVFFPNLILIKYDWIKMIEKKITNKRIKHLTQCVHETQWSKNSVPVTLYFIFVLQRTSFAIQNSNRFVYSQSIFFHLIWSFVYLNVQTLAYYTRSPWLMKFTLTWKMRSYFLSNTVCAVFIWNCRSTNHTHNRFNFILIHHWVKLTTWNINQNGIASELDPDSIWPILICTTQMCVIYFVIAITSK